MALKTLSGVRIWLSGSVPAQATPSERERLEGFVRELAERALREGATLSHGFHPSLTPTLLTVAKAYREQTGRRAAIHLSASANYGAPRGTYLGMTMAELCLDVEFEEIPEATTKEEGLVRLRNALAARADVLIAVGGNWWNVDKDRAGVPAEFELAITRGIPSFLLGTFGGATAGYLEEHDEILRDVRNGLDKAANLALANETDPSIVITKLLRQLSLLPLGRRETWDGERFRILSLDGGGIRGAFTAAVLAQWEAAMGRRVVDHFDLIAGTSTGGILAIGLGLGIPAKDLLDFYKLHGAEIFPMTSLSERVWHTLRQLVTSKFTVEDLEIQLRAAYDVNGVRTLADSKTRLLITSYNLTSNALTRYTTPHYPGAAATKHASPSAVAVGRATSAAPTYFPPATVDDLLAPHEAVDGGVWANCPAMAAIGEATGVLKIPLDRIDLLSVGTAGLPVIVDAPASSGVKGWALKAANLFMNSQMEATLLYARQLLGEDRFVRVDEPRIEGLDDLSTLDFLTGRGVEIAKQYHDVVWTRFLNGSHVRPWR